MLAYIICLACAFDITDRVTMEGAGVERLRLVGDEL